MKFIGKFKNPEILRNFDQNCPISAEFGEGSRGLVDIPELDLVDGSDAVVVEQVHASFR